VRRKKNFFHVLIIKFNLYRYYLEIREELRDYRDMKINVMMQWSIIAMLEKIEQILMILLLFMDVCWSLLWEFLKIT
jgi:hypothetical protein